LGLGLLLLLRLCRVDSSGESQGRNLALTALHVPYSWGCAWGGAAAAGLEEGHVQRRVLD